jgi:hypothetical protein
LAGDSAVALVNATILQGDGSSSNTVKSNKTGFIRADLSARLGGVGQRHPDHQLSAENKPSKVVVACSAQNLINFPA